MKSPFAKSRFNRGSVRFAATAASVVVIAGVATLALRQNHTRKADLSCKASAHFRIGYQKSGILNLQRLRGGLERRLHSENVQVDWVSFPAGPQILEGISAGDIDAGWTGDAPVIFALASGSDIAFVANSAPDNSGESRAIIVPGNSSIHQASDLTGKRIAVQKGSGSHNLLVQVLEHANVPYQSIHPVYLAPADARAAFETGSVDAWTIWDPYLAIEQKQLAVRTVAGGKGIVTAGGFYVSRRDFARKHPRWLQALLSEAEGNARWAELNPTEASKLIAPQAGLDPVALETTVRRLHAPQLKVLEAGPLTDEVINAEQKVADEFLRIGLLPSRVDVRKGLLTPQEYAAFQVNAPGAIKVGQVDLR